MIARSGKPAREKVPKGEVLCQYCTAKCCRYFALPMDVPTEIKDFEYIRWFIMHERASVFTEDDSWYLLVHTVCQNLQPDNRCGIYHTRPQICREYSTDECEYEDDWTYDRYFETADQVQDYMDAIFAEPGDAGFRSPKPPLLPVLTTV